MPDQKLIDYIKISVASGVSRDVIERKLADSGWSAEDV